MAPTGWLQGIERRGLLFQAGWLCLIFIIARGLLITFLWALFHGNEPSTDIKYYLEIGSAPLAHFLGRTDIAAYPPVQGFMLWPATVLNAGLPAFAWTYRVFFVLAELALYVVVLVLARDRQRIFTRLLALTLMPLPVLATSIWAQEEILAAALVFFGLIAWHKEKPIPATVIWSFGVIAGKIYVLPLLVLALTALLRSKCYRGVVAGVAIVAVGYAGRLAGGGTGFEGFLPDNEGNFQNTLWSLPVVQENLSLRLQMHVSAVLCAAWAGLWWLYWLVARPAVSIGVIYALISLGIFLLFFHINPEYYLLPYFALFACFALGRTSWRTLAISGLVFSCAWIHNVAYVTCVTKKLLTCAGWMYPYASLMLTNAASVVAIALMVSEVIRPRSDAAPNVPLGLHRG